MTPTASRWQRLSAQLIDAFSGRFGRVVVRLALLLMTLAAGARLTAGVVDLLWQPPPSGASDLAKRHFEVELWFSGEFDYDEMRGVKYPPASYVLFWPLLGWLPFQASRWLWAGLTALALVWLALVTMRESGSKSWTERAFVVLMLLSISATGVSISTGQPSIMLLSFLIGGTFLLQRGCPSWRLDLLGAAALLGAMLKPTLSAPFIWFAAVRPAGPRPLVLVVLGYALLTLAAAAFEPAPLPQLLESWLRSGRFVASMDTGLDPSLYANLHWLLGSAGFGALIIPASLLALVATGLWVYRHRDADLWLRLSVVALVARLWAYHRVQDDLLILIALVALFRLARSALLPSTTRLQAGMLLAGVLGLELLPGGRHLPGPLWAFLAGYGRLALWLLALAFLIRQSARSDSTSEDPRVRRADEDGTRGLRMGLSAGRAQSRRLPPPRGLS